MAGLAVFGQAAVAFHDVFCQAVVLLVVVDQLFQHAVEDCGDCEETLDCGADVVEAFLVAEDFLDDEGGDCFGQGLAVFHYAQA